MRNFYKYVVKIFLELSPLVAGKLDQLGVE